jgi:hypothetical protein
VAYLWRKPRGTPAFGIMHHSDAPLARQLDVMKRRTLRLKANFISKQKRNNEI